jgi:hypothetical protein
METLEIAQYVESNKIIRKARALVLYVMPQPARGSWVSNSFSVNQFYPFRILDSWRKCSENLLTST